MNINLYKYIYIDLYVEIIKTNNLYRSFKNQLNVLFL